MDKHPVAVAEHGDIRALGEHATRRVADLREQIARDCATAQALRDYLAACATEQSTGDAAVQVDAPSQVTVAEARAYARRRCAEHQVEGDRRDTLELAVSELVGNAVRHGRPPLSYKVTPDGEDLLLTVSDGDPAPPGDGRDCGIDCEGGRGLFLIANMARSWGWERTRVGKVVWARI